MKGRQTSVSVGSRLGAVPDLPAPDGDPFDGLDIVVLGAAHGTPYPDPKTAFVGGPISHCATAPAAVRAASQALARFATHWDFDLDGPLVPGDMRIVDGGDVATAPEDAGANRRAITEAIDSVLAAGPALIVFGGDDSIPIPLLAAHEQTSPITILQLDVHIDWRDDVAGVRFGFSSTMRRASEMGWIERMVQVGIRGVGDR